MAFLLAIGSAVLYGAADFTGGLVTRRAGTIPVVILSQASGLILLALILPAGSKRALPFLTIAMMSISGCAMSACQSVCTNPASGRSVRW